VVGEGTGSVVEKNGFALAFVSPRHSAAALAATAAFSATTGLKILLPQALDARPDFVKALAGRHQITALTIYKKVPVKKSAAEMAALRKKNIDWVLFFSPSAIDFFLEDLGGEQALGDFLQGKKIAIIGQTTFRHLKNKMPAMTALVSGGDLDQLISLMGRPISSR
jgi:uroporphyrinogen-III synthase